MIRGLIVKSILLVLLVNAVTSVELDRLQITKAVRQVNLGNAYAGETIKISFVSNGEGIDHFIYIAPLDYSQKISKIWFTKSEKDRWSLQFHKGIISHGGITYNQYKVQLPNNYNTGDLGEIQVHIIYLYRFVNLPASITLTQDQKVQYQDVKFMVSPYHILQQDVTYKMHKVIQADTDFQKRGMGEITFNKNSIEPFTLIKHKIFGVNNNPLVQFTSVQKVIEVSHWGNVGVSQHYKILNKGPSLKGQFSRVTFGSRGGEVKNAFKGIEFDLPEQIWGLYYLDQVGNITTSRAYRDERKKLVHVQIAPRFALLGGWKSNWQIGYNINTLGHLFNSGNRFELKNIMLQYALQKILAEEYTIKLILPEGAENVKIIIGGHVFSDNEFQTTKTQGYLDFNGRPTFIIPNYQGLLTGHSIDVQYDFNQTKVYEKILYLIVIVFVFLGAAIFLKRFKLQAFEESKLQ